MKQNYKIIVVWSIYVKYTWQVVRGQNDEAETLDTETSHSSQMCYQRATSAPSGGYATEPRNILTQGKINLLETDNLCANLVVSSKSLLIYYPNHFLIILLLAFECHLNTAKPV